MLGLTGLLIGVRSNSCHAFPVASASVAAVIELAAGAACVDDCDEQSRIFMRLYRKHDLAVFRDCLLFIVF